MAKAKQQKAQTVKKKLWVPIVSKNIFEGAVLGETTVEEKNTVVGKPLKVNLAAITGEMKKQNIRIGYKVIEIRDDKAQAVPTSYSITNSLMRRIVRKGKDRVEGSFLCVTKDNKVVRVKPLLITKNNTYNSVKASLMKNCHASIANQIKKLDYYHMFNELVMFKLQGKTRSYLSKTYPLRICEIKELKIIENGDASKVVIPKFKFPEKPKPRERPKEEKVEKAVKEEKPEVKVEKPAEVKPEPKKE